LTADAAKFFDDPRSDWITSRPIAAPHSGGLRRPETQYAVGFLGREAPFHQHVIEMGDQFAGGKTHLVHVEHMLVEYHGHQFLGGLRHFAAGIGD
jgi:hypothetical protein